MKKMHFLILPLMLICQAGAAQSTYKNPVYNSDSPDPSVQRAPDGTFYCYATGCQTRKSKNLVNWSVVNDVISRPTWNDSTYTASDGTKKTDYYSFWACDVNHVDGKYLMYYACALWGNGTRTGIGVATGTRPDKFTDKGKLFRSTEIGVNNSIDPCYVEEFDHKYLVWGSFNDLYITELSSDGLSVKNMKKKTKVAGGAFEGVMIYKRKGYYYMFASVGSCCEGVNSTYRTVVGRSAALTGPYVNKNGGKLIDNNYTTIIKGNDAWKGPGHNSEIITDDNGDDWLLYHAYSATTPDKGRVLMLDKITWGEDGWPTVGDGTPSTTSQPAPVFYSGDGADITYKWENMDLMKSDFKGWTATSDGGTFKSGQGTAFEPLGWSKGANFKVYQTLTGLSNGLYELRCDNFQNHDKVEFYMNDCATRANVNSRINVLVNKNSELLLTGNYTQHIYGLVTDGVLTIGMQSTDSMETTDRFAVGNMHVIYRENNATACDSVWARYKKMAEQQLASSDGYYEGYRTALKDGLATFEASTDSVERYNALLSVHEALSGITSSKQMYDSLRVEMQGLDKEIQYAQTHAVDVTQAQALYAEAEQMLQNNSYTLKETADLISRIKASTHDLAYTFERGDGTEQHPYVIVRPEQLDHMHDVDVPNQMVYYQLDADIDMAGFQWSQLNSTKTGNHNFINFDGQGHIIRNLTPANESGYPSFFGTLCGECRNVGFVDAHVDASATGASILAGYVGNSNFLNEDGSLRACIIENCYVTGDIQSKGYVGGLVGYTYSSPLIIRNVYTKVAITGIGKSANYVGGIVGRVRGDMTLQNSYAAGPIDGPVAGGVVAGGQATSTPGTLYENVIAWNDSIKGSTSAEAFGKLTDNDQLSGCYINGGMLLNGEQVSDGKSHQELQQIASTWGTPWYSDPTAGNGYPILQWQYDRGDYRHLCGFPLQDGISSIPSDSSTSRSACYSLSGQQVARPSHGLFIVEKDGVQKKVLYR